MGQEHPCRPNPPLTRTTLCQLCSAPWVSQSQPAATEPGLEPGSLVAQLALLCSALDRCTTRYALSPLFLTQLLVQPDYTVIAMKYETVHTLITQLAYVFCMEYNALSNIRLHSTARYCFSQPFSPLLSSRHGDGGFSCVSPTTAEQQL